MIAASACDSKTWSPIRTPASRLCSRRWERLLIPDLLEFFASQRINSSFGDPLGFADPETVVTPNPFLSWSPDERQVFADEGAEDLLEALGYGVSPTEP